MAIKYWEDEWKIPFLIQELTEKKTKEEAG
jgi:hypothetical protein